MTMFFTALFTVLTFLGYAVPGFIFTRTGMIKSEHIASFSKVLIYVCSPCLAGVSVMRAKFTSESVKDMLYFTLAVLIAFFVMMFGYFFIMKKKSDENVKYRVGNIACCFSNCAFFGVPVIENLFPGREDLIIYTAIFSLIMNMVGWTVGSALLTRDKKYIRLKNVILNPVLFGFAAGLIFSFSPFPLPARIYDMISLLGKMTTPMCMLILGMRLGTSKIREVFTGAFQYILVAVNQIAFPLLAYGISLCLPGGDYMKYTICILCSCPVASVVLNYSELVGAGQKDSAKVVLIGSLLSVITMPCMTLILPI